MGVLVLGLAFEIVKGPSSVFENRSKIWGAGLGFIVQKPILGHGTEAMIELYDKYFYESGFPLSSLVIDRSHNLLIDVAVWSGLTGLAMFLIWLWKSKAVYKVGVMGILFFAFFQPLGATHWVLFIVMLAG